MDNSIKTTLQNSLITINNIPSEILLIIIKELQFSVESLINFTLTCKKHLSLCKDFRFRSSLLPIRTILSLREKTTPIHNFSTVFFNIEMQEQHMERIILNHKTGSYNFINLNASFSEIEIKGSNIELTAEKVPQNFFSSIVNPEVIRKMRMSQDSYVKLMNSKNVFVNVTKLVSCLGEKNRPFFRFIGSEEERKRFEDSLQISFPNLKELIIASFRREPENLNFNIPKTVKLFIMKSEPYYDSSMGYLFLHVKLTIFYDKSFQQRLIKKNLERNCVRIFEFNGDLCDESLKIIQKVFDICGKTLKKVTLNFQKVEVFHHNVLSFPSDCETYVRIEDNNSDPIYVKERIVLEKSSKIDYNVGERTFNKIFSLKK